MHIIICSLALYYAILSCQDIALLPPLLCRSSPSWLSCYDWTVMQSVTPNKSSLQWFTETSVLSHHSFVIRKGRSLLAAFLWEWPTRRRLPYRRGHAAGIRASNWFKKEIQRDFSGERDFSTAMLIWTDELRMKCPNNNLEALPYNECKLRHHGHYLFSDKACSSQKSLKTSAKLSTGLWLQSWKYKTCFV